MKFNVVKSSSKHDSHVFPSFQHYNFNTTIHPMQNQRLIYKFRIEPRQAYRIVHSFQPCTSDHHNLSSVWQIWTHFKGTCHAILLSVIDSSNQIDIKGMSTSTGEPLHFTKRSITFQTNAYLFRSSPNRQQLSIECGGSIDVKSVCSFTLTKYALIRQTCVASWEVTSGQDADRARYRVPSAGLRFEGISEQWGCRDHEMGADLLSAIPWVFARSRHILAVRPCCVTAIMTGKFNLVPSLLRPICH